MERVTLSKKSTRRRKIISDNDTCYISLPREIFGQHVGQEFFIEVNPLPNGAWQITLAPTVDENAKNIEGKSEK
jgi:hypothetical protein